MAKINVLDQDTINQIAAGEVVERPASVVKELVENAIDARASAVTVEIKGGGIDFIRITDNGSGIEKDQIRNAFLPHATSKIMKADDLITVSSLGFRGEALSSICSVSRMEIISKTDEELAGVRCLMEGGEEISFEEVGCPEGTTFLVKDLFYNTPARKKFLKSAVTEAGYVESFIQRLALSRPDISFKFIYDNKNKISTSGNGNLKDVIYQIFGRDIAANLLPVDYRENGIRLQGFIGKPVISRGNRNFENYYVNGRYLKDNILCSGIEEGYKGHAMIHRFPFCVLMIEMDPHQVDVNVHPRKMEMRFHNGSELYDAVVHAVRNAFVKKDLISQVGIGEEKKVKEAPPRIPEPFEKKRREIEARFSSLSEKDKEEIQARKKLPEREESEPKKRPTIEERLASLGLAGQKKTPEGEKKEIDKAFQVKETSSYPRGEQLGFKSIPVLSELARPRHRIVGQIFKTYWLIEYEDQLYFVDQHAAHEKVMYEKLLKDLENNQILQQMMEPPTVLSLSIREKEMLERHLPEFEKLGFSIEAYGGGDYCIRAVPANLLDVDPTKLFVDIFDQLVETEGQFKDDVITERLASMACKAAVKGNSMMSYPEMDRLMDQLLKLDNPFQCPHGRPTIIAMSKREIEKKFKRIT